MQVFSLEEEKAEQGPEGVVLIKKAALELLVLNTRAVLMQEALKHQPNAEVQY